MRFHLILPGNSGTWESLQCARLETHKHFAGQNMVPISFVE
jgi:hypothetical protein